MSTVAPPPPPTPPSTPTPGGAPTVTVNTPPQALLTAALGAKLTGQVLPLPQGAPQGQVPVQTPLGTLLLNTQLPIPQGAALGLVVQTLAPQVKVQIATINGQPAAQALRAAGPQGTATAQATPQAAAPPSGQPSVNLTTGKMAVATVLRPPQSVIGLSASAQAYANRAPTPQSTSPTAKAGQPSAQAPQSSPGTPSAPTPTTPHKNAPTPASPQKASGKGTGAPPQPSSATPKTITATTTASANTATAPKVGSTIAVRVADVQPPRTDGAPHTVPTARPAAIAQGTSITGVISRTLPTGQPVLNTALGEMLLTLTDRLPVGSRVTLTATAPLSAPTGAAPTLSPAAMITAGDWPALREAVNFLGLNDPAQAQHLLTRTLARPDGQLASSLFFFIASVRGGDVRSWLSPQTAKVLDKAKGGLMNRLADDFRGMKRQVDNAPSNDWRSYMLPFHAEHEIQPIRLHVRGDDEPDEDGGKKQGTRFLIDLTLTRLGTLQLDGLVNMDDRSMNMILRSDAPLPQAMRADLLALYTNASDVTGMKGSLSFQAAPANFVTVTPVDRIDGASPSSSSGVLV